MTEFHRMILNGRSRWDDDMREKEEGRNKSNVFIQLKAHSNGRENEIKKDFRMKMSVSLL